MNATGLNYAYRPLRNEIQKVFMALADCAPSRGRRFGNAAVETAAAGIFTAPLSLSISPAFRNLRIFIRGSLSDMGRKSQRAPRLPIRQPHCPRIPDRGSTTILGVGFS